MKKVILLALFLTGVVAVSSVVYRMHEERPSDITTVISFPQGGERLEQGKTYTLSWKGGPDSIQIFLIDRSLKDEGASVSISDRIYGVPNEHAYRYTVPADVVSGEYELQIGDATSKPFSVVSSGSRH